MRLEKANRRLQLELKNTNEQQGLQNRQVSFVHKNFFPQDLFYYMMWLPSMLIYADITFTQILLDSLSYIYLRNCILLKSVVSQTLSCVCVFF